MWLLTALLFGRVVGQLLVFFFQPKWLPPMEQWQSGLVPYPFLVSVQVVVLWLMVSISYDYSRGEGFWWEPHPMLGVIVLWWSILYFAAMIVRYVVRMSRRPDQRWLGGTIPIVFHSFVAMFQWLFAAHHVGML
jgi:hypothetical protein